MAAAWIRDVDQPGAAGAGLEVGVAHGFFCLDWLRLDLDAFSWVESVLFVFE